MAPDTPVYRESGETTYRDIYLNLKTGAALVLRYGATGKLEYLYLPSTQASRDSRRGQGHRFR